MSLVPNPISHPIKKPFGSQEKCVVCTKTVYATERLASDERVYHKACFRCTVCDNQLKLGNYASMESKSYCKPCFKKLFFTKGNYSEGFGKLRPQQEFDAKRGGPETTVAPVPVPVNSSVVAEKKPVVVRSSPDTTPAAATSSSAAPAKKYVPNTFQGIPKVSSFANKPVNQPKPSAPTPVNAKKEEPETKVEEITEKLEEVEVQEEQQPTEEADTVESAVVDPVESEAVETA